MNDIFKLIYLDQDNIKKLIVFLGDTNSSMDTDNSNSNTNIDELFVKDSENSLFKGIFSKDQLDMVISQKVDVHFSKQIIYIDDTIETVKKKLIIVFTSELLAPISFDEIYLFSKQIQTLNNSQIYDSLTQNGKITLTRDVMVQFLSNINNINEESIIPVKDIYTYNDIIDLNLTENPQLVNLSLGQRFIIGENMYSFTINPFKVKTFDKLLRTNADNILTTTNKDLLLTSGYLFENTIYVCLAEDVLKNSVSKNISESVTSKVYYPFLSGKQILDLKQLRDKKYELLEENKTLISNNFTKQVDNVKMFHEIYNTRKSELNYIEQGVQMVEFVLSQDFEFNIPLDVIFKLIHATKTIPFIKLNSSKKHEKIYRIYCNKTATNGKKIPYLSKNMIFKLVKTMGASKRVSCYMEYTDTDDTNNEKNTIIPIIVEFDSLANIYIKAEFKEAKQIPYIEKLISKAVNPVIEIIRNYIVSSGYSMILFNNLYDKHVELINLKYFSYISIDKNINLNNLLGCVSSVFNVLVGELKKGIVMRYKRVSNFNEMDSQEAFIVELLNRANEDEDIVKLLMDNFQLKETDAQLKIADLLNSLQMVQTLNKRRKLKIKNNPGFLTKITQDPFKQNIMVEMENINDIFYMSVIPIYIDSLIRITQVPESSNVDLSNIDGLCKTKQMGDIEQINEIIAPSEKGITENIPVAIIAENLAFGEMASKVKEKSINVLDFLYDDDEDEDEDEDEDDDEDNGIEVELEDDEDNGIEVELEDDEDNSIEVELEDDEDNGIEVELEDDEDNELSADTVDQDDNELFGGTNSKESTADKEPSTGIKVKKPVKLTIRDDDKLEQNITGMRIADPNPFFKAMYQKDPALFLTESDGKYSAYSRVCPWNKRKQPVILTDAEKKRIDEQHPGSYGDHAIKYGSDPNKQYWYICPRYWDLKNNTSLTEDEVKSGKYGGVIPQDAKTVPAGKNIWEFTDAEGSKPIYHVGKKGEYVQHYPGFLKEDVHPGGLRVPCCFKKWKDPTKTKEVPKQEVDEYIKGPEKFPLEENRFGYLPFIVQKFIDTDNKQCQISITNKNLKKEYPCYLRKGPESSKNKSFLACMADIYGEKNDNKVLTLDNFINEKLVEMLTPDTFISLQNGSLISEFQSPNLDAVTIDEIKDSIIYSKLNSSEPIQLKRIVSALQNFIEYLKSSNSQVDYTYLWDLICQPNELLFSKGINLVILNLPHDDITANINIICPTNYYSLSKYDPLRETAIIIQKYEYFEPIYIVTDKSKTNMLSIATTKLYSPELMKQIPNLNKLSNTIQDIYKTMCNPLSSLPKAYKYKEIRFKRNITLEKSIEIINRYNFNIVSLVVNYDDKVIGLNVVKNQQSGFIPCFPSGLISSYELVDLDNEEQLKNLEETLQFLKMVTDETNGEILCKPVVKILEDKLLVGLLTETNQFIALIEPELNTDQSIKYTVDDENFFQVDKITQTSKQVDKTREEYVKKIKLETELYNAFRNKLRTLLNNFKNKNARDDIESISNSVQMVYFLQLEKLIRLIKQLMSQSVEFVPVTRQSIKNIEDNLKQGDILLIPKNNLLSSLDNEEIYYSKISDELIRYNRIKQFMFKPKMFLSFIELKYDLSQDEIILLQSLLTQDYFDELIPDFTSKYISFNSYDTTEPSISQKYDNTYNKPVLKEIQDVGVLKPVEKMNVADKDVMALPDEKPFKIYNTCPFTKKDVFSKLKLKFRGGYKDIVFSFTSPECTFDVALTLINNTISSPIDINGIKQGLIRKYQELFALYPTEIINLFDYYGYMSQSKELANNKLSIENIIMTETYHITNFDLIVISDTYDIPLTLIAPNVYRENNKEYLSVNVKKGYTYIIRTSGVNKYNATLPKFKMIVNKNGDGLLKLVNLPEQSMRNEISSQNNSVVSLLKAYNKVSIDETITDMEYADDADIIIPKSKKIAKIANRKLKLVEAI